MILRQIGSFVVCYGSFVYGFVFANGVITVYMKFYAEQIAAFAQKLRKMKLERVPGLAEVLDWAKVLASLELKGFDDPDIEGTYHFLVKSKNDFERLRQGV